MTRRSVTRIPSHLNTVILQSDTHSPDGDLEAREVLMFTPDAIKTHMMVEDSNTNLLQMREITLS